MSQPSEWATTIPHVIYQAFLDSDLLPLRPPRPGDTIDQFAASVRTQKADLLFRHLCEEARTVDDADEYLALLEWAILDIQRVRDAVRLNRSPRVRERLASHPGAK